ALYVAVKKARKAQRIAADQAADGLPQLAALEADLARLRGRPLTLAEVEVILTRHKLRLERPLAKSEGGVATPVATPYRTYIWSEASGLRVPILVGKGATANDELCRRAKSND